MLSLRELQQRVYRAVLLEEPAELPVMPAGPARTAARLEVYRNNARETFRRTLAATYPVLERLVGAACFRSLARAYMRDFPSQSGDLGRFGTDFPTLLEICYADTEFAYLADVARLERALAEAETASGCPPLDLARLGAVAAARYPQLRFRLHPAVRLVSSRFPVYSLWRAHRDAEVAKVDLRAGAEHVLIGRDGTDVVAAQVSAADYAFVRSLADGETLADALDAAATLTRDFDPARALGDLTRRSFVAECLVPF